MTFIVIDAGVWIRLARFAKAQPLVIRFSQYELLPVINSYLLSEVHTALIKNKWATVEQANIFIEYIEASSFTVAERSVYRISPDPKDNYLFDLALQNNCSFIVSDDHELLRFPLKPVPVKSCNWFLKHFPVK